jgi:hypothetical protein
MNHPTREETMAMLDGEEIEIHYDGEVIPRLPYVAETAMRIQAQHYMCEPEDAIRKAELLFAALRKRVAQWSE